MVVSNHAYQRSSERSGFSKKATNRIAERAFTQGLPAESTKGQLKKWADEVYNKSTNDLRSVMLYGDKAYLFSSDEVLITVLQIPAAYIKTMNQIKRRAFV